MIKPILMGAIMGPMMMWMAHGALTGNTLTGAALITFVAAHVALALVALALVIWGARMSPRLHAMLSRLHRPTLAHVATMAVSALAVAGIIHLLVHGLGVLA